MILSFLIYDNWALLVLRIALGVILIAHGLPKIKNISGTAQWMEPLGFRPGKFWAAIVALLEFVGGIFLIAGLLTQIVAIFLAIEFLIIILKVKRVKGLVGGYEFDLIILAAALVLIAVGPGDYSADHFFSIFIF